MALADLRTGAGVFDLAVLAALTIAGYAHAPWWSVVLGAVTLAVAGVVEHADLKARAMALAASAARRALLALAAVSIGFAALAYVGGLGLRLVTLGS